MGQMASLFNERQQGNLPSTAEVNPGRDDNEHCKAITLRNGKIVDRPVQNSAENYEDSVECEENNAGIQEMMKKLLKRVLELLKKHRSY